MNPLKSLVRGARKANVCLWPAVAFLVLVFVGGCGDFFVSSDAIVSIALAPNNPTIQPSKTQQFTATATLGDGTSKDVTAQSTWSSSNTSVATIDSSGVATAVAIGTTTITAASGGVTGSTTLTVSNQIVTTITIAPANPALFTGQTQQMAAAATLSDGTTRDVTTTVKWTTSNSSVVSITSAGLITGASAGTATVTATLGTVTASTTVTVT
jgi:uncharacterized protein YjdB